MEDKKNTMIWSEALKNVLKDRKADEVRLVKEDL